MRVKDNFDKFYKEYRDFIAKMDPDNLDFEKIKDMYDQAKGYDDYFNKPENSVDADTKARISLMLEKLDNWRNQSIPEPLPEPEASTHPNQETFTVPAPNVFTEIQSAIHSFKNEFTGSESVRTLDDQTQRLKDALAAVKDSLHTNGGTREEQKAISMIVKLDKTLKAFEKSKVPIPSFIVQRVVVAQVNRMKNSDEFNTGIVSLAKKAKPEGSIQFREESMDEVLGKEHLKLVRDFIERVDRLQDQKSGASKVELGEFQKQLYKFKIEFSQLNHRIKNGKSDIPVHELMDKFKDVTNKLSSQLSNFGVDHCLAVLSVNGQKFSNDKAGRDILRAHVDMVKISPEYLEYQQAKWNGNEKEHPRHETFAAVDECEKLLKKAISTQKIPLVSDMNSNKLKKFFNENESKIQPQEAPSSRASTSKK